MDGVVWSPKTSAKCKTSLRHINDPKSNIHIHEGIMVLIAMDNEPFRRVQRSGFARLMGRLNPHYVIPSCRYFSDTMPPISYDKAVCNDLDPPKGSRVNFLCQIRQPPFFVVPSMDGTSRSCIMNPKMSIYEYFRPSRYFAVPPTRTNFGEDDSDFINTKLKRFYKNVKHQIDTLVLWIRLLVLHPFKSPSSSSPFLSPSRVTGAWRRWDRRDVFTWPPFKLSSFLVFYNDDSVDAGNLCETFTSNTHR